MQNIPNHSLEQLFCKCLEAVNQISGETSEKSAEKYDLALTKHSTITKSKEYSAFQEVRAKTNPPFPEF